MLEPKIVVLVVEDNAAIRMLASTLLAAAGYETLEAGNADEAITMLQSHPEVRLVFTDIEMPKGSMDGIKLAHYIRDRWPPVQLILASGRTFVSEGELPTRSKFFPKPYKGDAIVEAVVAMLADDARSAA